MERLELMNSKYSALEASIHINRYAIARDLCDNARVLDISCGEGYGSALLKRWGASHVDGVDISAEAISKAQIMFKDSGVNYSVVNAQESDFFIGREKYDLIISLETIEHLEKPELFLNNLKNVLKESGTLIISCPNDNWYYPTENEKNPYHIYKYALCDFLEITAKHFGSPKQVFLGVPVGGFANVDVAVLQNENFDRNQLSMISYLDIQSAAISNDEVIDETNCSYFLAIWRNNEESSIGSNYAVYPRSMDSARKEVVEKQIYIDKLESMYDTLRWEMNEEKQVRYQLMDKIKVLNLALEESEQKLKDLDKVNSLEVELERCKTQLSSLDDENTILNNRINALSLKNEGLLLENKFIRMHPFSDVTCIQDDYYEIKNNLSKILNSKGYRLLLKFYKLKAKLFNR